MMMMPGMFALALTYHIILRAHRFSRFGRRGFLEEYEIVETRLEKYICHPDWIVVESFAD